MAFDDLRYFFELLYYITVMAGMIKIDSDIGTCFKTYKGGIDFKFRTPYDADFY